MQSQREALDKRFKGSIIGRRPLGIEILRARYMLDVIYAAVAPD